MRLVAWVGGQISRIAELGRVHEQARHDLVALGPRRPEQRDVAIVEGTHRRNQADRRARTERAEYASNLFYGSNRLHPVNGSRQRLSSFSDPPPCRPVPSPP